MSQQNRGSVEALLADVDRRAPGSESLELWVPETLTLHDTEVLAEVAMAIVHDRVLSYELCPDGFREEPGGRFYSYRRKT